MKYMVTWSIGPGSYVEASERFRATGAPMPDGLTRLGRWHEPGSATGFLLVEAEGLGPLATHLADWGDVLEFTVTPVMEDEEAAAAMPDRG